MRASSVDLGGQVQYLDSGGAGRPIVLVHGLGGSSVNWLAVASRLAEHGRVLAVDLAGHGRTRTLGRGADVGSNGRLLGRFLEAVAREPAVLVGNSMGGYLSLALTAAQPERVAGLVLVDPAVPVAAGAGFDRTVLALFAGYALPFVGGAILRKRARRGPERSVRDLLKLCCVDIGRIPADVIEAHVALARARLAFGGEARRAFLAAQRSLMVGLLRRKRFFASVAAVRAPTLILHGAQDRLVRVASVRALVERRPDWGLEVLDDVGHVPQIETPGRFLEIVIPWLGRAAVARSS